MHYGSSDLLWGIGWGPWGLWLCTAVSVGRWTSAHTSAGSVSPWVHTWVCLSAALWAFGQMSFSEVNLITQFYGQLSCSLIRLDQNLNPYPLARGMTGMPELAQGAEFLLSCFQVYVCVLYTQDYFKYNDASKIHPSF